MLTVLEGLSFVFKSLYISFSVVPPQRLSHRPLYADGDHHGAKTNLEQFHGARLPVSFNYERL